MLSIHGKEIEIHLLTPELANLIYNNSSDSFQIIECVDSNNNNNCNDINLVDHLL